MTDAESAARAAVIDGAGPIAEAGGVQAPPTQDEDAILGQLMDEAGLGGDEQYDEAVSTPAAAFDENAPITWTPKDVAQGNDIVPGRDEKGRFQPKATEAPAAAPTAAPAQTDQPAPAYTQDQLETGLRAFRRDGFKDEDLQRFSKEDIVRLGTTRSQAQAAVDTKIAELSQTSDPRTATPTQDEAAPTANDQGLEEKLEAFRTLTGEAFADDELGDRLASALGDVVDAAKGAAYPVGRTYGQNGTQEGENLLNALVDEQARARLGERFPTLKSDDNLWDTVSAKAQVLHSAGVAHYGGGLPGIYSAFEDSARILVGDPVAAREVADRANALAHRGGGNVAPPQTRAVQSQPTYQTRDQLDDAWLTANEDGDDSAKREIEALYSRIPV